MRSTSPIPLAALAAIPPWNLPLGIARLVSEANANGFLADYKGIERRIVDSGVLDRAEEVRPDTWTGRREEVRKD